MATLLAALLLLLPALAPRPGAALAAQAAAQDRAPGQTDCHGAARQAGAAAGHHPALAGAATGHHQRHADAATGHHLGHAAAPGNPDAARHAPGPDHAPPLCPGPDCCLAAPCGLTLTGSAAPPPPSLTRARPPLPAPLLAPEGLALGPAPPPPRHPA